MKFRFARGLVMMGLVMCACGVKANIDIGSSDEQRAVEIWLLRKVDCADTLLEVSTAMFPFENRSGRRIRIAGIRKGCGCAELVVRVGDRVFSPRTRGRVSCFVRMEAGVEHAVDFIEIGNGDSGALIVDLRLKTVGKKVAIVWVDMLTSDSPVELTIEGRRIPALWMEPIALDLGVLREGAVSPFTFKVHSGLPKFLQGLRLRGHGFAVRGMHVEVMAEYPNWCCKIFGFVEVDNGRKGAVDGRIRVDGVCEKYIQRSIVLRGYVQE